MKSYVIQNGNVYDPPTGRWRKRSVYIRDGLLTAEYPVGAQTINAAGCFVSPGFIDYHVHYCRGGSENGVNPDASSFPCGVTTAVDAGSCGAASYELFHRSIVETADVRLFTQLLAASGGQLTARYPECLDPERMDTDRIRELFHRYPRTLKGLKLRLSADITDADTARRVLEKTVDLAGDLRCNVTVHITNPAMDLEELCAILRPGDVVSHMYQNRGRESILDGEGHIRPGILRARERGVLFDACNGKTNFNLKTAEQAIAQGFLPDIISSDLNADSCYEGVLHSLPRVLSKYLTFGLKLGRILDAAILKPARVLGHPELATLRAGTPADLCIFRVEDRPLTYLDHTGGVNHMTGHDVIVPQMTIKDGTVVYSQVYFG